MTSACAAASLASSALNSVLSVEALHEVRLAQQKAVRTTRCKEKSNITSNTLNE